MLTDAYDRPRAEAACGYLACYLKLAQLAGRVDVVKTAKGLCLGVTLDKVSPKALELVPPMIDGFNVKVLV